LEDAMSQHRKGFLKQISIGTLCFNVRKIEKQRHYKKTNQELQIYVPLGNQTWQWEMPELNKGFTGKIICK
jgi:hypothetical protein